MQFGSWVFGTMPNSPISRERDRNHYFFLWRDPRRLSQLWHCWSRRLSRHWNGDHRRGPINVLTTGGGAVDLSLVHVDPALRAVVQSNPNPPSLNRCDTRNKPSMFFDPIREVSSGRKKKHR